MLYSGSEKQIQTQIWFYVNNPTDYQFFGFDVYVWEFN